MPGATLSLLLSGFLAFVSPQASPQQAGATTDLPTFDAATIKPPDPNAGRIAGFYGEPGGRVFFDGNLRTLIECAFNLHDYQLSGGHDWTDSQSFVINAVPPETSPSRNIGVRNVEPSPDQRLMLQSLLRDRFAFKFHLETKEGEVYILTRGKKPLQLKPPKDPAADPRATVLSKQGGIADGEAEGTNTTTDYLAKMLSRYLHLPVLNQTGITGSYDYYLPPNDPENHDDVTDILGVVDRLGLKIKRGRGPIQTFVIDHVEQPTAN